MEDTSDIELMQMTANGDLAAFEALVDRYQQKMLNYFLRMGVYTDGEDLVQETFMRLYRGRARYQPKAKFTTYLYTIARSVWVDRIRKSDRQTRLKEAVSAEAETEQPAPATDQHMDVRQAVAALPERLRAVVVLNVFEGLRYHEIADVLDIPEGTVKSRMHAAMSDLRDQLDE